MSTTPPFLYKYRSVSLLKESDDFSKDNSLKALLNSYAIFSGRKNFNDLFDSKVDFIRPTARQIKAIRNASNRQEYKDIGRFIKSGKITPEGDIYIKELEDKLNALIDSYVFFSVSARCDSNLMWSHYANAHQGFCIEFKSEHVAADEVAYEDEIPQLALAEVFSAGHIKSDAGQKIWQALRTKLKEWSYEEEYRFQLSDTKLKVGDRFLEKPYTAEFVESIIFGYRMPDHLKKYIADNMPYPVKLKQAVLGRSTIEIKDSHFVVRKT